MFNDAIMSAGPSSASHRYGTQPSPVRTHRPAFANVAASNLQVLNAFLYVVEHGCKWRGLPPRFGKWHTVYTRMNRWSKNGVLARVFEHLQRERMVHVPLDVVSLDSTSVKVHPDGAGALKKTVRNASASRGADGIPKFIWLPQMSERP